MRRFARGLVRIEVNYLKSRNIRFRYRVCKTSVFHRCGYPDAIVLTGRATRASWHFSAGPVASCMPVGHVMWDVGAQRPGMPSQTEIDLTFKTPLVATLAALSLSFATPVLAQEAETSESTAQDTAQDALPQIAPEDVTDDQVEEFVSAFLAVSQVRADYMPKIAEEEDQEARQALVDEANDAVITAVNDVTNMDAQTYVAIGKAAETDKALSDKISEKIEAAQSE